VGKTSKSTSDLSRGENVANVFKSGDLERAVKAHCAYLFKSKVVEGAEQPSLKAGETWDKVLAVSETIELPTEFEKALLEVIELNDFTDIDPVALADEILEFGDIDTGIYMFCIEVLVLNARYGEAVKLILETTNSKFDKEFLKYVKRNRLSEKAKLGMTDSVHEFLGGVKVDLASPALVMALVKNAEAILILVSARTKGLLLSLLVEIESRVSNDINKQFPKSLAKQSYLLVAKHGESYEAVFQHLVDKQLFSSLTGFIGRREKFIKDEAEVQLAFLIAAYRLGANQAFENTKSWKGLHFGHFAQIGVNLGGVKFLQNHQSFAKTLLAETLQKLPYGRVLSILDEFPGTDAFVAQPTLHNEFIKAFKKKKSVSTTLVNDIAGESIAREVELASGRQSQIIRDLEAKIQSHEESVAKLNVQLEEQMNEVASLNERIRVVSNAETIALSEKLRQAQLQSLISLCRLFEEIRIFVANNLSVDSGSIGVLSSSALRILKKQGVVLKGVVNEIYPLDRQLFEVIGTGVEQSGTVMAPAYVRESETGDDVLVRGTMTIS
jgi:hypothetical protein